MSDFLANPFKPFPSKTTKVCSKCKEEKPLSEFCKDKRKKDGLNYTCKLCEKLYKKEWYLSNKEEIKKNKLLNIEKTKKYNKEYYANNKEKEIERIKKYQLNNKVKIRERTKKYINNRLKTDIGFRLLNSCRVRLYDALKGNVKSKHTMELIGCTIEEFKAHLKSQFEPGMTMENYGKWHVDHIVPCSAYDMSDPIEQQQCFHYSNLRPLWATENQKKWKHWIV